MRISLPLKRLISNQSKNATQFINSSTCLYAYMSVCLSVCFSDCLSDSLALSLVTQSTLNFSYAYLIQYCNEYVMVFQLPFRTTKGVYRKSLRCWKRRHFPVLVTVRNLCQYYLVSRKRVFGAIIRIPCLPGFQSTCQR